MLPSSQYTLLPFNNISFRISSSKSTAATASSSPSSTKQPFFCKMHINSSPNPNNRNFIKRSASTASVINNKNQQFITQFLQNNNSNNSNNPGGFSNQLNQFESVKFFLRPSLQHPQLQQQNLNRLRYVRLVTSMLNNSYNGSSNSGSRLAGGSNSACSIQNQQQLFVTPRVYSIASPLHPHSNILLPLQQNSSSVETTIVFSSEMQKREQLSAKLLQSNSISNVNLNETNRNILTSNYRNRSATAASIETGFINNGSNNGSNNNVSNSNTKIKNGGILTSSIESQPQQQAATNGINKMVQDSNKFLDDILSHRRKSSEVYTNSNQYVTSSTIQTLSMITSNNVNNTARTNEERALHPDKLILDRRKLFFCPMLEGEDQLKLLNLQHNQIQRIQNLDPLRNLIFLDFYDNQIERITGISGLINLRVLMLGKNRISKIENLDELIYLDVLDLHANEITKIENLNHLHELRVLNIAANKIKIVENLHGLHSLVEFNLRRNFITEMHDLVHCVKLQRLFLSFNDISSFDAIKTITLVPNLQELALDGNPICSERNYKKAILSQIVTLKQLDMKKVSEDEKRLAVAIHLKEEEKKRELEKNSNNKERRRTAIKNVQKQWNDYQTNSINGASDINSISTRSSDVLSPINNRRDNYDEASSNNDIYETQSNESSSNNNNNKYRPASSQSDYYNRIPRPKSRNSQRSESAQSSQTLLNEEPTSYTNSKVKNNNSSIQKVIVPPNGGNNRRIISAASDDSHLVEIEGETTLYFYGPKSLEEIDNQLNNNTTTSTIVTIFFNYIEFNHIVKYFIKLRNKFSNLNSLIFTCCNLQNIYQLNSFSDLRKLENITINKEDNPIASLSIWKYYALFRLAHLQLKRLDDKIISAEEQLYSEKLFSPLGNLAIELPEYRLVSTLGQHRRKQIKLAKEIPNLNSIDYITAKDSVIKSFLTYYSNNTKISGSHNANNEANKKNFVKNFIDEIFSSTNYNDLKKQKLKQLQKQIWNEFVNNCSNNLFNKTDYVNNLCKKNGIVI